jgi:hypothetical protein
MGEQRYRRVFFGALIGAFRHVIQVYQPGWEGKR